MNQILTEDLGLISYENAWHIQTSIHEECFERLGPSRICVLEHTPVITLGKHADVKFLNLPNTDNNPVSLVHTDRGGEVTAHMPGQIVVYPIIDFRKFKMGPKAFVHLLEHCVIELLKGYAVESHRDHEHPGVWVGINKICALGIRIKQKISLHGLALNVNNSLDLFSWMTPCGIANRGVTSMQQILQRELDISKIKVELSERIKRELLVYLEA